MTVGIVVFPGSNCDRDVRWAVEGCLGASAKFLWHETTDLSGIDSIVLPGGFSYGDYLRCGAIARFAPVFESIGVFAKNGGPVIGICNGFQILTELGLLPGALTRNINLQFICENIQVKVSSSNNPWLNSIQKDSYLSLPIAHGEGRYYCTPEILKQLEDDDLIALKYVDNPNGSVSDIAGITNKKGNVLGLMPHPERSCDPLIGSTDGLFIMKNLLS